MGLTAAAVLQASNVTLLLRRSLRRLAGTIAGVALAGAVFALHPAIIAVAIVAILAQSTAEVVMRADQVAGSPVTRLDQVTAAIDELAMLALGLPFGREQPARPAAEALVRRLEQLAGAVENRLPPPDPHRSVELPGYPRTQAATELLTPAIG